ncbi:MAG: ribonuclease P protein component [Bacteroidia bacterium]|nr:ribonuclease P protein component [Bacteroidia bacterium]
MNSPESPRRYFFPKEEKLCSKKVISDLFEHGNSLRVGVLKFFYLDTVDPAYQKIPIQVAFAVPKRSFKKAFMRNRLKRRLRESYRLQKHLILPQISQGGNRLAIFVKYSARNEVAYQTIYKAMRKGLLKIKTECLKDEQS